MSVSNHILITFCILLYALFFKVGQSYAQTPSKQQQAYESGKAAIALIDKKQDYTRALALLETAAKLDPTNSAYPYEIAYVYYRQKEYQKTIKILQKLINKYQPRQEYYRLIGNAYDMLEQHKKSQKIYLEGLKHFPDGGIFYLELGGLAYRSGNTDMAVDYWEDGIKNAPQFASNYYWCAKLYCHSSEKIWGVIYGELFLNIEPDTKRSLEISQLMYKTYEEAMHLEPSANWLSLSKRARIFLLLEDVYNVEVPFQVAYELSLSAGLDSLATNNQTVSQANIALMHTLRNEFTKVWYNKTYHEEYTNVLFDWHKDLIAAGHFEAYNYWLLRKGNSQEFSNWFDNNNKAFQAFVKWIEKNAFEPNNKHLFYKKQYAQPNKTPKK